MWQSLSDMNALLSRYGARVEISTMEIVRAFEYLAENYAIKQVFSHQETGNLLTYKRDLNMKKWFHERGISWMEYPQDGIERTQHDAAGWKKRFYEVMKQPTVDPMLESLKTVDLSDETRLKMLPDPIPMAWKMDEKTFQKGGSSYAWDLLNSFLKERSLGYMQSISKPMESRTHCSRLSPYFAWGNLSVRQAYQAQMEAKNPENSFNLRNFAERLRWRNHFIQKFERLPETETEYLSDRYLDIRQEHNEVFYRAWENGETGYPLVDACMRCVCQTGYLNFRMRSMLVSFLTHHLWQDWKRGALFLARQFLDYEPGIHYNQFQMQSGTTGRHTVRIYNPLKQSLEQDPSGSFIRKWVPELQNVPNELIHEPWKLSAMEQQLYKVSIGTDYPLRLIDHQQTYREKSKQLWARRGWKPGDKTGKMT